MDAVQLVKAFCDRLGVKSEAETEGVFSFSADEIEFVVHCLPEEGLVLLRGDLGPVPTGPAEGLFRLMLEAQHSFRETAGATFSIDGARDCFTLDRVISCATTDDESFFGEVERFVNHLETWTRLIRRYDGEKEPPAAPFDLYGLKV